MRTQVTFIRTITRTRIMSLMILVAFSAVAVWTAKTMVEFYRFRPIRAQRLQQAAVHKAILEIEEKSVSTSTDPAIKQWDADIIRHRKDLEQKYRKGAEQPWAELPPDPPVPAGPVEQAWRDYDALNVRMAQSLRNFEKLKSENSLIEEKPDPLETTSPREEDLLSRRLHELEKKRADLMREREKMRANLMRKLEKRRSNPKLEGNSGRVRSDFF